MRDSEWRFDENPEDSAYDPGGVGQWSTASKKALNMNDEKEKREMKRQRMQSEGVKITTPEFRASFPALFEAKSVQPGGNAKYSVVMLFQTKETAASKAEGRSVVDIEPVRKLIRDVVIEKFGADKSKWPALGNGTGQLQLPLHLGTEPGKKDMVGYGEGIIFATASSSGKNARPGVVHAYAGPDGKPAPLTVPSDFYGGCYARATVNAYYWEYMGKLGVSLGLQNVQKLRDGEPFGGRGKAEEDFDAIPSPEGASQAQPAAAAAAGSDIGV